MTRTTEELLKDAEGVAALDKKRTQGKWLYSKGGYLDGCGDYDCDSIYLLDGKETHKHPETGEDYTFEVAGTVIFGEDGECFTQDIEFMAKAPAMASLIAELSAKLSETQEVLREIVTISDRKHDAWDKAKELLPTPPKKEQGNDK